MDLIGRAMCEEQMVSFHELHPKIAESGKTNDALRQRLVIVPRSDGANGFKIFLGN